MAEVRCVWANVPEGSEETYEKEHIADLTVHGAEKGLHCEMVNIGLETMEMDGIAEHWPWLTLYEGKQLSKVQDLSSKVLGGKISGLKVDARTYNEFKCWQLGGWNGDFADVSSVAIMQWSIHAGKEKEVLDFYLAEIGPVVAACSETLRFRLLKLQDATVLDGSEEKLDKARLHTYLTLVELDGDDWPWDVVVAMGANPKWREYFENRKGVSWASRHYLVNRVLPNLEVGN